MNQQQKMVTLAITTLAELKAAEDFGGVKAAVERFITGADKEAFVLGDGDLCRLAGESLKRRGKDNGIGLMLFALALSELNSQLNVAQADRPTLSTESMDVLQERDRSYFWSTFKKFRDAAGRTLCTMI
jgi:hypothetical protein